MESTNLLVPGKKNWEVEKKSNLSICLTDRKILFLGGFQKKVCPGKGWEVEGEGFGECEGLSERERGRSEGSLVSLVFFPPKLKKSNTAIRNIKTNKISSKLYSSRNFLFV